MALPLDSTQLHGHDRFVRRMALTLVRDAAAADDLVQEAWVVALQHQGEILSFRSWMRAVIRMLAFNHYRRSAARRTEDLPETVHDGDRLPDPDDAVRVLRDALEDLDERYAAVLRLHYLDELPLIDIARRLGVPLNTVKSRLHRGRTLLREVLDRRYGGRRLLWSTALIGAFRWERGEVGVTGAAGLGGTGVLGAALIVASAAALVLWLARPGDSEAPETVRTAALEQPTESLPDATRELASAVSEQASVAPRPQGARVDATEEVDVAAELAALAEDVQRAIPTPVEDELRIRVLTPDGRPLAGARVHGHGRAYATADAEGLATFRVTDDMWAERGDLWMQWNAGTRRVLVYATCEGYAVSGWHALDAAAPVERGDREPFELHVGEPDFVLRGRVVDEVGEPVPGALVQRPNAMAGPLAVELETLTDASGTFELAHLPQDSNMILVTKEDRAPTVLVVDGKDRATGETVVVLASGSRIAGTVRDAHGRPVADARVHFGSEPEPRYVPPTRTDEDGRFELPHCPAIAGKVWATSEEGSARVDLACSGRGQHEVHLTLEPKRLCRARLVDEDGAPFRTAAFLLRSFRDERAGQHEGWHRTLATDAGGHVEFEYLGEGPIYGYAFGDQERHHFPVGWAFWNGPSEEERVVVCRTSDEAYGRVRGSLLDAQGQPVEVGEAHLTDLESLAAFRVPTDVEGRFVVERVPPGAYMLRFVVPRAGRFGHVAVEVVEGQELDLGPQQLPATGTVRIECAWPAGGEVSIDLYERVSATHDTWDDRPWRPMFNVPLGSRESHELLPGTYRLVVQRSGRLVQGRTFQVRSDRELTVVLGPGQPPTPFALDVSGMGAGGEGLIQVYRVDDLELDDGAADADLRERIRDRGALDGEYVGEITPDGVLHGEAPLGQGRWAVLVTSAAGETGYVTSVGSLDATVAALAWERR